MCSHGFSDSSLVLVLTVQSHPVLTCVFTGLCSFMSCLGFRVGFFTICLEQLLLKFLPIRESSGTVNDSVLFYFVEIGFLCLSKEWYYLKGLGV